MYILLAMLAPVGFTGLLVLGRTQCGHAERTRRILAAEVVLAAMTGIGAASLTLLLPILPYLLVPAALTAHLANGWITRRIWLPLGCYLLGAGGIWLAWEAWSAWNDITDAAVSRPGWSPLPVVVAGAGAVLGAIVLSASSLGRGSDRSP